MTDIIKNFAENNKNIKKFLAPLNEEKIVDKTETYFTIEVGVVENGEIIDKNKFNAGEVYNSFNILKKFGEKTINGIDLQNYLEIYEKFLKYVPQKVVYASGGWTRDSTFILGNKCIENGKIFEVERLKKCRNNDFLISDKETSKDFAVDIFLDIFNEKLYSYIVFIFSGLALINSKLPKNGDGFVALPAIIGVSGSRKTSVCEAIFNPLGETNCCASFEDTVASIVTAFKGCNDSILRVDDLSHNTKKQNEILEKILRISGDKSTGVKKIVGGKLSEGAENASAVITGEFLPKIQKSSLARLLVLKINENSVNLEKLTALQNNPDKWLSFQVYFIEYIEKNPKKIQNLYETFKKFRKDIFQRFSNLWHPRCAVTMAWFKAGAELINEFMGFNFIDNEKLESGLYTLFQEVWADYGDGEPAYNFIVTFLNMLDEGELKLTKSLSAPDSIKEDGGCIIFAFGVIYKKVISKIIENGNNSDISAKSLNKFLIQEKILIRFSGKNTQSKKFSDGVSRRCIKINLNIMKEKAYGYERMNNF